MATPHDTSPLPDRVHRAKLTRSFLEIASAATARALTNATSPRVRVQLDEALGRLAAARELTARSASPTFRDAG